ncbi:DDE Tnp IS1595 domain-containing protein [Aphis craccivora]|uniref:DDE Tnp IS1595 domain-containing protein n=1 Tax=Aphis craccivora TaxID=307492 RepID=A0A6G0VTR7_APHCR|nr:DDE Tnp IS1595 domain-containing protein [Aphis craccivora]
MSHCMVVDWNNYMRELCTITISRNQQLQIGGPGKIVEIDEIPNRTKETLSTAIRQYIKVGTTIYSDCWRGYDTDELTREGYTHSTVNHSNNFVDPVTGVHTQHIERVWGTTKWRNKKHRGTRRHHLESYLAEFIWRQNIEGEPFDNIMKNISENWSPKIEFYE